MHPKFIIMKYFQTLVFLFLFFSFSSLAQEINHDHKITKMCGHGDPYIETEDQDPARMVSGHTTSWCTPFVIDIDAAETFYWEYVTDYTNVATITIDINITNLTSGGVPVDDLILVDDGTGNDAVAGDDIFASQDLNYTPTNTNINHVGGVFVRFRDVTYTYNDGTTQDVNIDLGSGFRYVFGSNVDINPTVVNLAPDMQYSSHVFNIDIDLIGQNPFSSDALRCQDYYAHFPDTKDVLMFSTTYATPSGPAATYSTKQIEYLSGVQHNVSPFDNSATYGSAGELNGIMKFYYTHGGSASLVNHEMMHQWGTNIDPALHLTIPGNHWNIHETPSSGFGSGYQRTTIDDVGNDCYHAYNVGYTSTYSELEQYLMGLIPITDVTFPIEAIQNPVWTNSGNCTWTSTDGLINVTEADFLAAMGPRDPQWNVEQHDFESAMIVLSRGLLTPKEMSYFQWQMQQNEMLIGDPDRVTSGWSTYNFNEATDGNATLTTRLPCPGSNVDLVITDNPIPVDIYSAAKSIEASTPTASPGNTEFKAGEEVNLEIAFEVPSSLNFEALIENCP